MMKTNRMILATAIASLFVSTAALASLEGTDGSPAGATASSSASAVGAASSQASSNNTNTSVSSNVNTITIVLAPPSGHNGGSHSGGGEGNSGGDGNSGGGDGHTGGSAPVKSSIKLTNEINARVSRVTDTSVTTRINVTGDLHVDNSAMATLDNKQINHDNHEKNNGTHNHTDLTGGFNGASGNIGVNQAAGDNNQQVNAVSLAVADANFLWGAGAAGADAIAFQDSQHNHYDNMGVLNHATIGDNSFNDAHGNVMVNNTAGYGNQQKNDMAIAMANKAVASEASIGLIQQAVANTTDVDHTHANGLENTASIGCAFNNAQGNIAVNVAAGNGNQQFNGLSVAVAQGGYTVGGRP